MDTKKNLILLKNYLYKNADDLKKVFPTLWIGKLYGYKFKFFINKLDVDSWVGVKGPQARKYNWPAFYNVEDLDRYMQHLVKIDTLALKNKI